MAIFLKKKITALTKDNPSAKELIHFLVQQSMVLNDIHREVQPWPQC